MKINRINKESSVSDWLQKNFFISPRAIRQLIPYQYFKKYNKDRIKYIEDKVLNSAKRLILNLNIKRKNINNFSIQFKDCLENIFKYYFNEYGNYQYQLYGIDNIIYNYFIQYYSQNFKQNNNKDSFEKPKIEIENALKTTWSAIQNAIVEHREAQAAYSDAIQLFNNGNNAQSIQKLKQVKNILESRFGMILRDMSSAYYKGENFQEDIDLNNVYASFKTFSASSKLNIAFENALKETWKAIAEAIQEHKIAQQNYYSAIKKRDSGDIKTAMLYLQKVKQILEDRFDAEFSDLPKDISHLTHEQEFTLQSNKSNKIIRLSSIKFNYLKIKIK